MKKKCINCNVCCVYFGRNCARFAYPLDTIWKGLRLGRNDISTLRFCASYTIIIVSNFCVCAHTVSFKPSVLVVRNGIFPYLCYRHNSNNNNIMIIYFHPRYLQNMCIVFEPNATPTTYLITISCRRIHRMESLDDYE